jgi:hypothetical protein
VVADLQAPRVFDILSRLEHIAYPDFGAEGTQECCPQAAKWQAAPKKQAVHEIPAQLLYSTGTGGIMGVIELAQVGLHQASNNSRY